MTGAAGLILLPAVDVAGGRSVRLVHGTPGGTTGYGDPLAAARTWQEEGAQWLHLVDIDAAFGRGSNHEVIAGIVGALDIPVHVSGGVRDEDSLRAALSTRAARVNLSTAALADPVWVAHAVARHGELITVGLDVRGSRLAARGSDRDVGDLLELLSQLDAAGAARYVVTDVFRDGAMTGPNLDLLRAVCARTDRPVIASGGIGTLADVSAVRALVAYGVEGAILGQALYTGNVTLADALAAAVSPSWGDQQQPM